MGETMAVVTGRMERGYDRIGQDRTGQDGDGDAAHRPQTRIQVSLRLQIHTLVSTECGLASRTPDGDAHEDDIINMR